MTVYKKEYPDGLLLRNALPEDAQGMIDHMHLVDAETIFMAREPGEFQATIEEEQKIIGDFMQSPTDLMMVAVLDGHVVGSCGLRGSSRKRQAHQVTLGIAVQKAYWGRKIGSRIMEAALEWAQQRGVTRLELEVDIENERAIALYERMGFVREGTMRHVMRLSDGSYRDLHIMGLLLGE